MAKTPVLTIGAQIAAAMQPSVCRFSSARYTSPATQPQRTALPTQTTVSQNGFATHSRFVNWSVPAMPAIRQTTPNTPPRNAPAPGPKRMAPTTIGTSVREIGTGPILMPLATVCSTTMSAASSASDVRRTTDVCFSFFISTSSSRSGKNVSGCNAIFSSAVSCRTVPRMDKLREPSRNFKNYKISSSTGGL